MTSLTCYKISAEFSSAANFRFEDLVEPELLDKARSLGPVSVEDFTAQAFLLPSHPRVVPWAAFIESGFPEATVGNASSPSALVLVRVMMKGKKHRKGDPIFAFTFGTSGRHLLDSNTYEHNFGLRTALNIIYPRAGDESSRMRSIDTKQRGQTILRKRQQSSELSDFEVFGVNRLSDVMSKASGVPSNKDWWGTRITGGDSISFERSFQFSDLGDICKTIEEAHSLDDYRERFDWIDYIRPISDPELISKLERELITRLRTRELTNLSLAPPEILDWEHVTRFRFSFDRSRGMSVSDITRFEARLGDWIAGLSAKGLLNELSMDRLRSQYLFAVDGEGAEWKKWPIVKCLVGELVIDKTIFILDEGAFFEVRKDYVKSLDSEIDSIPMSTVNLPDGVTTMVEADYNQLAAASDGHLLLDRQTVRISGQSSVEICDLLSKQKHLIHVKRHLGSSDLSHLFAQGFVSAESLQMSTEFRAKAQEKIEQVSGGDASFAFFGADDIRTSEYEVVYAIVEQWKSRTISSALPFFSKVNLREVNRQLIGRGFRVAMKQIEAKNVPDKTKRRQPRSQ